MKILLVDDEKNIRTTLQVKLTDWKHEIVSCVSLSEAVSALTRSAFDVVLTDYRLGEATGSDVIREVRKRQPGAVIVVMTAYSSIENAVQVTKEGAFDYLQKPFTNAQLEHVIAKCAKLVALVQENLSLKSGERRLDFFSGMTSPAMLRLEEFVNQVAPTDETILMIGESGTGKSELAKVIHHRSKRSNKPLVTVYCTTLAESLLESELFGHVKGAFTGAVQDRMGKFEQADGGTVFLDEIGDLSPNAQSKLLRFLQERIIERVGGTQPIRVDARVLAATNRDLAEEVEQGRFREDLFYRLNMLQCDLVPLRYRREDIPVLVDRFLREAALAQEPSNPPELAPEIHEKLESAAWRGNVRELKNVIDRMVILSRGRKIALTDFPESLLKAKPAEAAPTDFRPLDEIEREHIAAVLAAEPNFEKAANILGITTVTLWRRRKQYGLP